MQNVNELISSSLAFEKAFTLADTAQREASGGHGCELSEGDGARLLYDDLTDLKKKYRKRADEKWKAAKEAARVSNEPYENLANAIVERVVLDYEIALSVGDEGAQAAIENFARGDFCYTLTKLDIVKQLEIVKSKAEVFFEIVADKYKDIEADTAALRRANKPIEKHGKYKCPLCGGRLYEFARKHSNRREYHCTGCALFGYEPIQRKKRRRA